MGNVYVYFGMFIGFCLVVVMPIVYIISDTSRKNNKRIADKGEDYRKLAESAVYTQQAMLEGQQKLIDEVAQLNKRITAVEKLLREVE